MTAQRATLTPMDWREASAEVDRDIAALQARIAAETARLDARDAETARLSAEFYTDLAARNEEVRQGWIARALERARWAREDGESLADRDRAVLDEAGLDEYGRAVFDKVGLDEYGDPLDSIVS